MVNSHLTHHRIILLHVEERRKCSVIFSGLCFEERQIMLLYVELVMFCFYSNQKL